MTSVTNPVCLNSGDDVGTPERPFAQDQAYIMVAVRDETDGLIPGFEAEKCVIRNEDRRDIRLTWGDASAGQLAGRTIRLRFFLRSANVYAITAAASGDFRANLR